MIGTKEFNINGGRDGTSFGVSGEYPGVNGRSKRRTNRLLTTSLAIGEFNRRIPICPVPVRRRSNEKYRVRGCIGLAIDSDVGVVRIGDLVLVEVVLKWHVFKLRSTDNKKDRKQTVSWHEQSHSSKLDGRTSWHWCLRRTCLASHWLATAKKPVKIRECLHFAVRFERNK